MYILSEIYSVFIVLRQDQEINNTSTHNGSVSCKKKHLQKDVTGYRRQAISIQQNENIKNAKPNV